TDQDPVITDMTMDTGTGLAGAAFDQAGQPARVVLQSRAEIALTQNANETFDYSLTQSNTTLLSGSSLTPTDPGDFGMLAKSSPRLAGVPLADIIVCATQVTTQAARSAFNFEPRSPEPDLIGALTADAEFQDVAVTLCTVRFVVEPRLRDAQTRECTDQQSPEGTAGVSTPGTCIRIIMAQANSQALKFNLWAVAIDIARQILIERFPESTPPDQNGTPPPGGDDPTPPPDSVTFTILLHQNSKGDFGAGGAGAQVTVSGDASFPTISWSVPNVAKITLRENDPNTGRRRLYGITTRREGVDPVDWPVLTPPITYGDTSAPGVSVLPDYPASSPALAKGIEYSLNVEAGVNPTQYIPGIVFRID
ncbi:MAG: hypothetical protein ACE5GE_16675, partial [Phycisphaerae bacterium]